MSSLMFERMAVVGVGLIGGSIALAAKERGVTRHVVGVGRRPERLNAALKRGIIDEFATDAAALDGIGLAVVCTPVDRIAADVRTLLETADSEMLITDAGSVKAGICRDVRQIPGAAGRFVGSHPLAGSHHAGFEHADPRLFENRYCVVTPDESSEAVLTHRIRRFWQGLGMQVREMSPKRHDEVLAITSHLPHLAAAAVASLIDGESVELASTGFRDTTRIAAGDPDLWTAIFTENAEQLTLATDRLISVLEDFREAVVTSDAARLRDLLSEAQTRRRLFDEHHV